MTTIVGTGAAASGTGAVSPALPTGTTTGDVLVLFIETGNEAVAAMTGWTEANNSPVAMTTAQATRLTVRWKRAVAGESAPTVPDPGDHVLARILGLRGVSAVDPPFSLTANGTGSTATTSATFPTLTTTVPGSIILNAVAIGTDVASTAQFSAWANSSLTTIVEQIDTTVADGNGGGLGVVSGMKGTAGAVLGTTATVATAATKAVMTLAVAPITLSQLTDDFSGASIDAVKWSGNYGTTLPTQISGVMTIPCRAGEFDGAASAHSYVFDDWRVQVTPPGGTLAAGSYIEAGVKSNAAADGTDAVFYIDLSGNLLYPSLRVNYGDSSSPAGIAYAPTGAHKYLRMVASAGNVLFQASSDGITYSTLRTATMPTWMSAGPSDVGWHVEAYRASGTGTDASIDDFNLAPTSSIVTTGTGPVAVTATVVRATVRRATVTATVATVATAVRSSTRVRTGTAAVTTSASATRVSVRTTAGTATAATSATASRSTIRPTSGSAGTHVTATAVSGGRRPTATTAAVTTSASATRATARATAGVASVTTSASATRSTARTSSGVGHATVSASATSSRAGRTAGTGAMSVTATATRSSIRPAARVATVTTSASSTSATLRAVAGAAPVHVTATAQIGSEEHHVTAGAAAVSVMSTFSRSTTRTAAGTLAVHVTATASASTSRPYARTAAVAVSAGATTGSEEHHVTTGTATAHVTASASTRTVRPRAGTAAVTVTASATAGHDEPHITAGTAHVYVTAAEYAGGDSGAGRITTVGALARDVTITRALALTSGGRPVRDMSVTRPRRVTG